jgi:hypothetical protein
LAVSEVADRIEVRLDLGRRQKLAAMTGRDGGAVSDWIRRGIDLAHEEYLTQEACEAIERLAQVREENMPDPDELKRQILQFDDPLP